MRSDDFLKLFVNVVLAIAIVILRKGYFHMMELVDFSVRFERHLLFVIEGVLIIGIVRRLLIIGFRFRKPGKKDDNIILGTGLLTRVFHVLFAIILALSFFDVGVGQALSTISLIAVAVVLITKEYISSTLNGMILAFSDHLKLDDHVRIGEHKGKVQAITLSHVQLLTDDDDIVFIPNNLVFSGEVVNYTLRDVKKSNIDFEIDPEKHGNIDLLEKQIVESMTPMMKHINVSSFNLKVVGMKEDAIHLKFQYVLMEPVDKELEKIVRRFCSRRIIEILHRAV